MTTEGTNKKEDRAASDKPGTGGGCCSGFDMMKKFCTDKGAFSDCADMMKSRMGMTTRFCCGAGKNEAEHVRREE